MNINAQLSSGIHRGSKLNNTERIISIKNAIDAYQKFIQKESSPSVQFFIRCNAKVLKKCFGLFHT